MNKVWICYKSWDYEGCSIPLAAFDSYDKAKKWCEDNKSGSSSEDVDFEELELK